MVLSGRHWIGHVGQHVGHLRTGEARDEHRGDKVNPETIESALVFGGIERVGVMSFENEFGIEEVWAAIAALGEVNESELRAFCYKVLPASVVPRHFVRLAELLRPHRAAGPRA